MSTMRAHVAITSLLLVAACGGGGAELTPDAGGSPDAPPATTPDAGGSPDAAPLPDAGSVTVIDWHAHRGVALVTQTFTVPKADLTAVTTAGFVAGGGCTEAGCRYDWYDLEGRSLRDLENTRPVNSSIISPDGSKLLLLQQELVSGCGEGERKPVVAEGTLHLLDTATGDPLWSRTLRTNIWSTPAFTPSGRWFGVGAIPDGACEAEERPHSVADRTAHPTQDFAPFAELGRDRFLGWRGYTLGVGDMDGSFTSLGDDGDAIGVGGGWVHAGAGYSYAVEKLYAFSDDGRTFSRDLDPDAAFRLRHSWGRYALLCRDTNTPSPETCNLVDVTGELPTRTLYVDVESRYDVAVLDGGASIAYVAPGGALERFDVAAAHTERVAEGPGTMHRLGDGGAVLWLAGGDVILVEAGRAEPLLRGDVSAVVALPGPVREGRETAQARTAMIVQSFGVEDHRLWFFDHPSRRLVRMTDRLYYAPHAGNPYGFDDCGVPRPMRLGGHPGDLLRQDARWAFFLEQPEAGQTGNAIWAFPLDLHEPPRKLAAALPVNCRSPMSSPDGSLLVVNVEHHDGVSSTITVARP